MAFAAHVPAIFKQQVLATFIDGLVLFVALAIFAVSNLINNAVKIGHYMEQIKNDFGLRQFFLTALINGSHMSMTTASMPLR